MSPSEPSERYHALDSLRAAMMLLGLALHTGVSYTTKPYGDAWLYKDRSQSLFFDCTTVYIHLFRMPVFFVMAGFFGALLYARRGARELAQNRFRRILLPLAAGWVLTAPLTLSGFAYANHAGRPDPLRIARQNLWPFPSGIHINLGHLWFLYYLVLFYLGALLLLPLLSRIPAEWHQRASTRFRHVLQSPWRALLLAVPTFLTLIGMPFGVLDTDPSLLPSLSVLAAYTVFFGFGWLLYRQRDLLKTFVSSARLSLWATLPLYLLMLAILIKIDPSKPLDVPTRLLVAAIAALIAWLLIFGLVGLFERYFSRPSPLGRYLADSSYWLYIIHLPLVVWLSGLLALQSYPAGVKFLLVFGGTAAITLISYDLFVRSTWIGVFLNGRRYPRALQRHQPPEQAIVQETV